MLKSVGVSHLYFLTHTNTRMYTSIVPIILQVRNFDVSSIRVRHGKGIKLIELELCFRLTKNSLDLGMFTQIVSNSLNFFGNMKKQRKAWETKLKVQPKHLAQRYLQLYIFLHVILW